MGLIKNTYSYSFAYNIKASAPIDSRMRVEYISDLTTVWNDEDAPVYAGMVVSVLEDNTLYVLKAKEGEITKPADYTDINNWIKIGSGSSEELEEILEAINANQAALQEVGEQVEKNTSDIVEIRTAVNTDFPVKGVEVNETNVVDEETKVAKITINTETITIPNDITINGGPVADDFLNGNIPAFSNGVVPSGMTLQEFITYLVCIEDWPSEIEPVNAVYKIGIYDPNISAVSISDNQIVEVGSTVQINSVSSPSVYVSKNQPAQVLGFRYGYSTTPNMDGYVNKNTITEYITASQKEGEVYSMSASSSGFIGTLPDDVSGTNGCTLDSCTLTADFGTNTYEVSATGPKYEWEHAEIPSYYIASSLHNFKEDKKSDVLSAVKSETTNPSSSKTFSVTGVYPIYTNMSNGTLVNDATTREPLVSGNSITISYIPSQAALDKPFILDYPAGRDITSFREKGGPNVAETDVSKETYKISDVIHTVNGTSYNYKRITTDAGQGAMFYYKITFDKFLSEK